MTFNQDIARRIREALAGIPSLQEVKMFGGLSFLVDGQMLVSASRTGDMLVRCAPEDETRLLAEAPPGEAIKARLGNRRQQASSAGWIRVSGSALTDEVLEKWLGVALESGRRL